MMQENILSGNGLGNDRKYILLAILAVSAYNREKEGKWRDMGTEIELKLELTSEQQCSLVLQDADVQRHLTEPFRVIPMATVYYDTEDYILTRKRWTLRLRKEGDSRVLTLKIPISGRGGFSTRGEWQCQADSVDQCAQRLIEAGAPEELERLLDGRDLLPLCGAEFTRNTAVVRFEDGSEAELALDTGILSGNGRIATLRELELELLSGSEEQMLEFAQDLTHRYQLVAQPLSKFARAAAL